ncbi:hypothetical protein MWU59_02065 [Flavobacteriaceae bacterium F08102]|nr:hypothetical protein [Flavobacteriaceae bacterium F08102]
MHKKLEAELVSLAHSILQMKNRHEAIALKEKAKNLYEKLSVLAFVDDYIARTPNLQTSKDELLRRIEAKIDDPAPSAKPLPINRPSSSPTKATKPEIEREEKEMFQPTFDKVKIDIESLKSNQISSKEEFRDTISADKTSTLFEDDHVEVKKTLNDRLLNSRIQVGLNDRIAFVQHLFNFSQSDFNLALDELNKFDNVHDAKNYILKTIKPKHNWDGKEEYEERLIALIERKFS